MTCMYVALRAVPCSKRRVAKLLFGSCVGLSRSLIVDFLFGSNLVVAHRDAADRMLNENASRLRLCCTVTGVANCIPFQNKAVGLAANSDPRRTSLGAIIYDGVFLQMISVCRHSK